MHPLRHLFEHARPLRRDAAMATVYSCLNKVFDILPELLIGAAVDVVVNRQESFLAGIGVADASQQLYVLAAVTVVVWTLESLFEFLHSVRWRNLAQDVQHRLRMAAYEHIQKVEPGRLESERTGKLMAVLNEDVHQVERFLNGGANALIQVFVSSILVGTVFFVITSSLAVLALLPIPLILFGAFWFQRRLAPRYTAAREAADAVSSRLNNNLVGMATIQAYTAEASEAQHLRIASADYRLKNAEAIRFSAAITPVIRMAILAGFTATLVYGGMLTLRGELGVGSYSALVYLTQRLLWPMTRLAEMTDLYQRAMASVERVLALVEAPLPTRTGTQIIATHPKVGEVNPRGALSFDAVRFSYGDAEVLRGVTFEVPAGSMVALVGATGSGKSTLLKLLLRFMDPASGTISIDGRRIQDIDLESLRLAVAYVAQEPFLTDGTVVDNIAYGTLEQDLAMVKQAAAGAQVDAFIDTLPGGYGAEVGERGTRLSGGQRQRIAIARALYRNSLVLILDEATSAVDNETEAAIQSSLDDAAVGRTRLVVAHRLSTTRYADRIHVLHHGQIVESGSHDELVALGGHYASLWRLQTGERQAKGG